MNKRPAGYPKPGVYVIFILGSLATGFEVPHADGVKTRHFLRH